MPILSLEHLGCHVQRITRPLSAALHDGSPGDKLEAQVASSYMVSHLTLQLIFLRLADLYP